MTQQYRVTNTTIKPIRTNSRGEDIRPVEDRNGYGIQIVIPKNPAEYHTLYRSGQSVIVDMITQQMEKMHSRKQISIEPLDVVSVLRDYAEAPKAQVAEPVVAKQGVDKTLSEYKSKSAPMGDEHKEERLVNPDGEPNFVAKAPRGGLSKSKKEEPLINVQAEV